MNSKTLFSFCTFCRRAPIRSHTKDGKTFAIACLKEGSTDMCALDLFLDSSDASFSVKGKAISEGASAGWPTKCSMRGSALGGRDWALGWGPNHVFTIVGEILTSLNHHKLYVQVYHFLQDVIDIEYQIIHWIRQSSRELLPPE